METHIKLFDRSLFSTMHLLVCIPTPLIGCIPTNYEFPNCFIGFQSQNNEKHHSDAKAFPQGKASALQIGCTLLGYVWTQTN